MEKIAASEVGLPPVIDPSKRPRGHPPEHRWDSIGEFSGKGKRKGKGRPQGKDGKRDYVPDVTMQAILSQSVGLVCQMRVKTRSLRNMAFKILRFSQVRESHTCILALEMLRGRERGSARRMV